MTLSRCWREPPSPVLHHVLRLTRKVDVRLPGKGDSNSHGARPVILIITMIKWIRTSTLSIKNSLCAPSEGLRGKSVYYRVQGLGFRVSGFGFRVSGLGFRVSGFGYRVQGFGFRVSGFGFRVSGFGFRNSGLGFRVQGRSTLGRSTSGVREAKTPRTALRTSIQS